jgi:hypothetical protein
VTAQAERLNTALAGRYTIERHLGTVEAVRIAREVLDVSSDGAPARARLG